ncbi:MAG: hypothetical protein WA354_19540, partial [Terracidiphilus sp.]
AKRGGWKLLKNRALRNYFRNVVLTGEFAWDGSVNQDLAKVRVGHNTPAEVLFVSSDLQIRFRRRLKRLGHVNRLQQIEGVRLKPL